MSLPTLRSHAPAFAVLTPTMLNKSTIDANASIRAFAKLVGVDYDQIGRGEKIKIQGEFTDGTPTVISFYRCATRADRRFSVKDIKRRCKAGDTVALTFKVTPEGDVVWVVNVTQEPQYRHLVEAS